MHSSRTLTNLPTSRTKSKLTTDREWCTESMYWLPGYLYWGDWQKLENKTDWTQTSDQEGDIRSHISEHHRLTKHKLDWDSAECVTYSTNYQQWLTLESWFTNSEQEPLNRCQQLPAPYKRLIHHLKRNQHTSTINRRIENSSKTTTDESRRQNRDHFNWY